MQQQTPITITNRNIALCIVLSIVTCGIYALYWIYRIVEETNAVTNNPEGAGGITVILLSIVTCNIYSFYWMYKLGQRFDEIDVAMKRAPGNKAMLYLLLEIFGLGIVNCALIQSELNKYATA